MNFRAESVHLVSLMTGIILCLVIVMAPAMAIAQDSETPDEEPVEATQEQLELNAEAVEAMVAGENGRAVSLLTDAFRLGELNILALNLGRAYHAAGNCERAREMLEQVSELPAVDNPSPERVEQRAAEYLAEVDESCEEDEEHTDLEAPDADEQPPVEDPGGDDTDADGMSTERQYALIAAGTGAALLLTGGGFHLAARLNRNDALDRMYRDSSFEDGVNTEITQSEVEAIEARANVYDSIALGTAIAGAAFSAVGAYFYFTAPADTQVSLDFDDQSWAVQWSVRF